MGWSFSLVSVKACAFAFNVTVNCSISVTQNSTDDNLVFETIGAASKGEIQPDPDVAGIGVLGVFVGVAAFALLFSCVSFLYQVIQISNWKRNNGNQGGILLQYKFTGSFDTLETLVQSCSDQQVLTSLAYALTLRYQRMCSITVYHYNIITHIMLLTCATHILSMAITRQYWKFPLVALLRFLCIFGLVAFTGFLMFSQDSGTGVAFPTIMPSEDTLANGSLMYLAAACFKSPDAHLNSTLGYSTAIQNAAPTNKPWSWRWYLCIISFYGAVIIAEISRFCLQVRRRRDDWRTNLYDKLQSYLPPSSRRRIFVNCLYLLYLAAGIGISCGTVIQATRYVYGLRSYVDRSGWLSVDDDTGENAENNIFSYGQLAPILLSGLFFFAFLQRISEKWSKHKKRREQKEELDEQMGRISFFDPEHYDIINNAPSERRPVVGYDIAMAEIPETVRSNAMPTRPLRTFSDKILSGSFGVSVTTKASIEMSSSATTGNAALRTQMLPETSSYDSIHDDWSGGRSQEALGYPFENGRPSRNFIAFPLFNRLDHSAT